MIKRLWTATYSVRNFHRQRSSGNGRVQTSFLRRKCHGVCLPIDQCSRRTHGTCQKIIEQWSYTVDLRQDGN